MKQLLLSLYLLIGMNIFLQAQNLNWVQTISNTGSNLERSRRAICTDREGNIYSVGFFYGELELDPGEDTLLLVSQPGSSYNGFISKADASGNLLWVKQLSGQYSPSSYGAIVCDSLGNVVFCGNFKANIQVEGAGKTVELLADSNTQLNGFVLKLSAQGELIWIKKLSAQNSIQFNSMVSNPQGELYVAGVYSKQVDFNPAADTFYLNSPINSYQTFVLKLSASGDFIWVKGLFGKEDNLAGSIALTPNNQLIIGGNFQDSVDFDPGNGSKIVYSKTGNSYILKLSEEGELVFVKTFTGSLNFCHSICVDKQGNILSTGQYIDTVDFNPGVLLANRISPVTNTYVSKLDSLGNFLWVKTPQGNFLNNYGLVILCDDSGNVYTAGNFNTSFLGPIDFDPGAGTANENGLNENDIFIQKLNTFGQFVWVKTLAGMEDDRLHGFARDNQGNLLLIGAFSGSVDFDPGPGTYLKDAGLTVHSFFLQLGMCSFRILVQPKYTFATLGSNSQLMVKSSKANVAYQWQLNNGSGFGNLSDNSFYSGSFKDTLYLKNIAYASFAKYRCVLQDSSCNLTSHSATLSIACDYSILAEPKSIQVKEDSAATFNIQVSTGGVNYQWQMQSDSGFVDIMDGGVFSGVHSNVLRLAHTSFAQNNYRFRCRLNRSSCVQYSTAASLWVVCNFSFIKQPVSVQIDVTQAANFAAKASVASVAYRWQENRGDGFRNILDTFPNSGSQSDSLLLAKVSQLHHLAQYRCIAQLNACENISDTAQLLVNCRFRILAHPKNLYLQNNQTGYYVVLSSDTTVHYQWQLSAFKDKGFRNLKDSVQTAKLKVVYNYTSDKFYRCLLSDSLCTLASDAAELVPCTQARFLSQPANQQVYKGNDVAFTVTTEAFAKIYQWQIKSSDTGFTDLNNSGLYSGVTTAILRLTNVGIGQNNKSYRCRLGTGNCAVYSNTGTLTVINTDALDEKRREEAVLVYPNPFNRFLGLDASQLKHELSFVIQDISGQVFVQGKLQAGQQTLDLEALSSGMYLLRIGTQLPVKIIKSE